MAIHDQGIRETDDMAQRWQTVQSWEDGTSVFPPGFFLLMQHLIVHLPFEARLGGPVQARWCYPIEQCLKTLSQEMYK